LITPIGLDIDTYWRNIISGNSGVGPIASFDTSSLPISHAGEVKLTIVETKKYLKQRKQLKLLSRNALLAMIAAGMAIEDSNLHLENLDPHRIGVYLGTTYGQRDMEDKIDVLLSSESESVPSTLDTAKYGAAFIESINPVHTLQNITNLVACHIAIAHNCRGPVNTFITSVTAGAQAIGGAYRLLTRGNCDIVIAGGTEATIYPQHLMDCALYLPVATAADKQACRPFDARRTGMVLGEGAGFVILERLQHACKRGARIYGELIGYGTAAGHIGQEQLEDESSIATAMENALLDGALNPTDVKYVIANGDSTPVGDRLETRALKKVFGAYAYKLPVSAIKPMTGHLWSASAAVELITCLLAMRHNLIPPTINYEYADPDCDLDYVPNKARPSEINCALCNSVGWFGQSASLILKSFKDY
jgi:3-oxoacyl-[acyl-carrier-protein] synthase II